MQAAVYRRRGPADQVLEVTELPDPVPGPGEVRVRLAVSGVNPTDVKSRAAGPPLATAVQVPGQDGAGVVDAVGPGVDQRRVGESVWVYHAAFERWNGTAATMTCVPAGQAVRLPDGLGPRVGATLGIPGITAHRCVFADGPVRDRTVLVTGGAGAVGHAAVQLARWGGARVLATVSSSEKARLAEQAGAHVVLNYRDPDHAEQLRRCAPEGVDRVVEVALGANLAANLTVLAPHGTVAAYASEADDPVIPTRQLMIGNVVLRFVLVYHLAPATITQAVTDLTGLLVAGAWRTLPAQVLPLAQIVSAHRLVERGTVGRVLVELP